ncbi:MAG TPA: hypothetical protein VGK00_04770 [Anaerolineales bacterium]|jgi:hypothetical protein
MTQNPKYPDPVRIAQVLFFINAALWLALASQRIFMPEVDASLDEPIGRGILAVLLFGNAALMVWCGLMLGKRLRLYFYIAVMVLVINVILTVTDQIRLADLLTLLVDLALLGILSLTRKNYQKS